MLNETDKVGDTFKRAFFRVDGVAMYFFWAVWMGLAVWQLFDPSKPKGVSLIFVVGGMMNPFIFLLFGVMRTPAPWTALLIVGLNVRFLIFG